MDDLICHVVIAVFTVEWVGTFSAEANQFCMEPRNSESTHQQSFLPIFTSITNISIWVLHWTMKNDSQIGSPCPIFVQ